MSLIGKKAPYFKQQAAFANNMIKEISLDDYKGKYLVLFFYPLDFTFVCPTELHAFQDILPELKKRGVELLGCSVDSQYTHLAWLNTPKSQGGIQGIEYGLLADIGGKVASSYEVLNEDNVAYRGLFLIDKNGIVKHQLINDLPLGRSTDEVIRMVDALQHFEKNGEVCPANWQQGKQAMQANKESTAEYLNKN